MKEHGTERESHEHLAMKKLIVQECIKSKREHDLEVVISDEYVHIVDAIIGFTEDEEKKFHNKGLAVECQCSSISTEEYSERNLTYLKKGYTPWWILGGNYFFRAQQSNKYNHVKRVRKIEKELLHDYGVLYYIHQDTFFRGTFVYKKTSSFLGMGIYSKSSGVYHLVETDFQTLLTEQMNRFMEIVEKTSQKTGDEFKNQKEEEIRKKISEELPKRFIEAVEREIQVGDLWAQIWLTSRGITRKQSDDLIKELVKIGKLQKTKFGLKHIIDS